MKYFRSAYIFVCVGTFLLFLMPAYSHKSSAFLKENKFLVSEPILNLHKECSEESTFVTQTIYGHQAYLVEKMENGWARIETEDGYQGYALIKGLISDNPRFRTSQKLCRISSISGIIYFDADLTKNQALLRLPFDARIELIEDFDNSNDRWLQVKLIDRSVGWIQRGDIEKLKAKSLAEVISLSHKFQELPYIWGGTSSEGFDCSGYIQTLFKQMGLMLPRDSQPQAACKKVFKVEGPEAPGDLVCFGDTRIMHIGLYLGNEAFIHAGVRDNKPKVAVSNVYNSGYNYLETRRIKEIKFNANISIIGEEILSKMSYSWRNDNPVSLENLRYIGLNHWGFDGCVHDGELIVHKDVADEVVNIFEELFLQQYPIEKMLLVDSYQANDDLACEDNNSSAFCSRLAVGKSEWSYHSFGLAIDINTLLNPYHRGDVIVPKNGKEFLDRSIGCRGVITEDDVCYKAFISRGWQWGGHWYEERGYVDYQHFYKEL